MIPYPPASSFDHTLLRSAMTTVLYRFQPVCTSTKSGISLPVNTALAFPMLQELMLAEMHTMTTERRKVLNWMVAVDCVAGARDGEGILGRSDRGDCWAAVSLEPPDTEDWHNAQMQGNMFESMFGKLAGLPQNSGVLESLSRRYHPRRLSSSSTHMRLSRR